MGMTTFPLMPNYGDHVLVASPSSLVRQRVLQSLMPRARRVEQASGGAEALLHLENGLWQMLFLDRQLPDLDAEELKQTVRERYPRTQVVLLEDENDAVSAIAEESAPTQAGSEGNDGDAGCPAKVEREGGARAVRGERLGGGNSDAEEVAALPGMIGGSPVMQELYRTVRLVAPRDTAVLISGATGSGKELVARALYELSPRSPRNFVVVNCAAIPETLLEAELFGYSRGAFTGALQSYAGRIQSAHQGTLFLDEIGDMPLGLQPKLLRFLEQKELQRLGSSQVVRVDVRLVSASNADLLALVKEGRFREDLYYRLSAFPVAIPPLSARKEDIEELAEHFLGRFSQSRTRPKLSKDALARLRSESWRGNVRELQNVIERAVILAGEEGAIGPEHLMFCGSGFSGGQLAGKTSPSVRGMRTF